MGSNIQLHSHEGKFQLGDHSSKALRQIGQLSLLKSRAKLRQQLGWSFCICNKISKLIEVMSTFGSKNDQRLDGVESLEDDLQDEPRYLLRLARRSNTPMGWELWKKRTILNTEVLGYRQPLSPSPMDSLAKVKIQEWKLKICYIESLRPSSGEWEPSLLQRRPPSRQWTWRASLNSCGAVSAESTPARGMTSKSWNEGVNHSVNRQEELYSEHIETFPRS